jgi:TolA-binding protein
VAYAFVLRTRPFCASATREVPDRTHKPVPIDREKTLQAAQKYIEKKKYDRAIAEYQRIIQEDPNDARTLLKIGDLQARLQASASTTRRRASP